MNEKTGTSVSSEKEKVKESQSQCDTLARHPIGCRVGASQHSFSRDGYWAGLW